jgi:2-oxoglutarate dehydrogenase E2 component (dihydrolipoamide succinyltransferase)
MKIEIKAPSPGESVAQVTVAAWLAENGSVVAKDSDIAEIESEKATLTVSAPASGLLEIVVAEGSTVAVNELIGYIIPGYEEEEQEEETENRKTTAKKASQPIEIPVAETAGVELKATPLARAIITAHKVDTSSIAAGTQKIHAGDVIRLLKKEAAPTRGEIRKAMTPLRKKLSERLVSVKNETAMLTTFNEADMSRIIALRKEHGAAFQQKYGIKLGFMSFFAEAITRALLEFPNVNSQIEGDDMVTFPYVDLGIAVQTEKGLMVPVIKNTQDMTLPQLEKAIFGMAEKARNKKISLDEMKGGTFTITNGGVFGSLLSTPIINPPQAGILGMHNIVERPVAVDGQVVIRPMMYIALSYDHRIIDGKDSVLFLKAVKSRIENPGAFSYL